jgi:predicted N-acyltransferase
MGCSVRVVDSLSDVPGDAWDALDGRCNPFVSYAFLEGLERTGCIRQELGWTPHHVTLWDGPALVAAAPAYLKANSHGEFVFDHGWAEAYAGAGMRYYPKLLVAVPYSPIPGPRLLLARGAPETLRQELARALLDLVRQSQLSGVHVNFASDADGEALAAAGCAVREDVQFHWANRGYADFGSFIGALNAKRRKEIRRERERVARDGWTFETRTSADLSGADLDLLFRLYTTTFGDKGNYPALTRDFFVHLAHGLRDGFVAVLGRRADGARCMALFLAGGGTLYGRYWGTEAYSPGLHFEACYYQGLDHAISRGLERFEPGAQGEHKIARGFLPVRTRSYHWLRHEGMRAAVERALRRERDWIVRYESSVLAHSPYAEREP